jgi:multiple sugar transport system permease protein
MGEPGSAAPPARRWPDRPRPAAPAADGSRAAAAVRRSLAPWRVSSRPAGGPRRPPRAGRLARPEGFTGLGFATPAIALIFAFGLLPIAWSALLSFQNSNGLTPSTPFVGTRNYQRLLHDPQVRSALGHTLVYCALFVPGTMIIGLLLAVAMNRKIRFITFYRTAAYVTMAVSTINEALIFIWLFDPSYGIVNYALSLVGLPQQPFLNSPSEALFVIVAMTVWGWTGFAVIIYLAALQGIPQPVLDAAAMDGAGAWATFRRVTVPLLSPASLFLAVWLTINALQLFDEVYFSTMGGPLGATSVAVYYLYVQAFTNFDFGYASAIAYALFLIILVITAIQFRVGRRFTHYRS